MIAQPSAFFCLAVVRMSHAHTNSFLDQYEQDVDEIVAACNGDLRGAVKALMLVNEQLEQKLQRISAEEPIPGSSAAAPGALSAPARKPAAPRRGERLKACATPVLRRHDRVADRRFSCCTDYSIFTLRGSTTSKPVLNVSHRPVGGRCAKAQQLRVALWIQIF